STIKESLIRRIICMNQSNSQKQIDFEKLDFESKQNLVGFFDLLLKIDMRINPDLYKEDYQSNKEQKI
ncbi:hypothetical protein COT93_02760, partial [Candidatus Falkowbacteria bacterium CG10_big_fil_rev_8_21_14_0_10_37_18]